MSKTNQIYTLLIEASKDFSVSGFNNGKLMKLKHLLRNALDYTTPFAIGQPTVSPDKIISFEVVGQGNMIKMTCDPNDTLMETHF